MINEEFDRQSGSLQLIASENLVSSAVLQAAGSFLTNKYAEGYPGARYYGGCETVDKVERLAQERACELFKCQYVNVQPHSGSQANQAVFTAFLKPGDTILGMSLSAGGHLTHGSKVSTSGMWFNSVQYGVNPETGLIDYDELERLAIECNPKLIIAGFSSYSRFLDWERFRYISDKVGAILFADIAHVAGLVVSDLYPSPVDYAHVFTSTTHKTLRGPRGGIIMSKTDQYAKQINSALFPGIQGGPLMHIIAAKAVAFKEALDPDFKVYSKNVVDNAKVLASTLQERGIDIVTGGTDCHLMLVDLRKFDNVTGKIVEKTLDSLGIVCNKNGIPGDPRSPFLTSGIRLGSPALTSRGFDLDAFKITGDLIADVILALANNNGETVDAITADKVKLSVFNLTKKFPINR